MREGGSKIRFLRSLLHSITVVVVAVVVVVAAVVVIDSDSVVVVAEVVIAIAVMVVLDSDSDSSCAVVHPLKQVDRTKRLHGMHTINFMLFI